LIIAEAGVNHNGDVARAIEMVEVAAQAGADVVKFQAFDPDALSSSSAVTAPYQKSNTGIDDQISLLRDLALKMADFETIAKACQTVGIEFLATPFDVQMVDELIELGMKRIKVASGELTNTVALREFSTKQLPIILSTGMSTLKDIEKALEILQTDKDVTDSGNVTLLQCTSLYPAPAEQMHLLTIPAMREKFSVPVGLSDHSRGITAVIGAVALGATVIEKHFTLDRSLPGPDHIASLEPDELVSMVSAAREMTKLLGNAEKRPSVLELETAQQVRRSWHTVRQLPAGAMLAHSDLVLVRPAAGLPPDQSPAGRKLRVALPAGAPVTAGSLIV